MAVYVRSLFFIPPLATHSTRLELWMDKLSGLYWASKGCAAVRCAPEARAYLVLALQYMLLLADCLHIVNVRG